MSTKDQLIYRINALAELEGWAIFNEGDLQRDDEMDVFADDEAAVAHVRLKASQGSSFHASALAICGLAQA